MSAPSHEDLFAALSRLREQPSMPELAQRPEWGVVVRWVRSTQPRGRFADDAVQETLIAIVRHIASLEAEHAAGAVRWVNTIRSRKLIDLFRADLRNPARLGLTGAASPEAPSPVDLLERDDAQPIAPASLDLLIEAVEDALSDHVDASWSSAADRQLRRLQGRAVLYRALGHDLPAIRSALALGPTDSDDKVYKWIERGRPILLAVLARLEGEAGEVGRVVLSTLAERVAARRIDAGRPRSRQPVTEEP